MVYISLSAGLLCPKSFSGLAPSPVLVDTFVSLSPDDLSSAFSGVFESDFVSSPS